MWIGKWGGRGGRVGWEESYKVGHATIVSKCVEWLLNDMLYKWIIRDFANRG